ncbi:MAG: S1 RNA-binding domain-containing protein [Anaerolineales bacterium]|nr:S1 RNA-binding domain-containing protein [Anaerolineales bacterium]
MNLESSQGDPNANQRDDSFWAALFAHGETDTVPEDADQDTAIPVDRSPDGQLTWTPSPPTPAANPWDLAQQAYDDESLLDLTVSGYNKGGLLVQWHGLPGFVPASQLIDFPQFHVASQRAQVLKDAVNKTLTLRIIEVNPRSNRLILSERAAQVEAEQRQTILESIDVGDVLTGKVTNLTDFGAFVDLGGVEGLIHISELSWSRVPHPSKIVHPDQELEVLVLGVDQENERVALSLKQLHPDPWVTAETRYQPGQLVEGVVSNIVNYGAFVLLEPELEGLVHISELAEGSFLHPRNVVDIGDRVTARVLQVDGRAKRLALSLRGVSQNQ